MLPHVGAVKIRTLLKYVKEPASIFEMGKTKLCNLPGIGERAASEIHSFSDWSRVDRILDQIHQSDYQIVTIYDAHYPEQLKQIYNAPVLLWAWGNIHLLHTTCLAIVGSRRLNEYSAKEIQRFVPFLVEHQLSIVSGMAVGVDTLAHSHCIKNGGKTIAVLGSGFNRLYPANNGSLMRKIVEKGGCILSEYPPDQKAEAAHFPTRNRIVSGLSKGVWVVESDIKGGSMITASRALEQNREIFATPHPNNYKNGRGCNSLISKSAAKLVQEPIDILNELGINFYKPSKSGTQSTILFEPEWKKEELFQSFDQIEQKVLTLCYTESKSIDDLIDYLKIDWNTLQAVLFRLELSGYLKQLPGARFESS